MSELANCPFCGRPPEIRNTAGSYGYYSPKVGVKCPNPHCSVQPGVFYDWDYSRSEEGFRKEDAEELAKRAWNNRA